MKKKIIALLLCVCLLQPCFAVFAGADDTTVEYDTEEYNPVNKGTWVQASDGQYYNSEWAKFIDVEEYLSKARTDGYEHMQLIDVEEYFYINPYLDTPDFLLCLYVYNPERKHIPMNGELGVNYNCGSIVINGCNDIFMSLEYADGYSSTNNMFQRIFIPSTTGLYQYSEFGIDPLERKYEIEYLEFAFYSWDGDIDDVSLDTMVEKLVVNRTYSFTGANATKVQKVDGVSSPFNDLSMLLDIPKAELKSRYPVDGNGNPSFVFLEERNAGTDSFELYLYLHNPKLLKYNYLAAYFYVNGTYQTFMFDLVNSESALSKYKLRYGHEKFDDSLSVREYFISNMFLYKLGLTGDYVEFDARYVYSDIPSESFTPSMFAYDLSDTVINAPSFAGNGNFCFTKGEQYLITFESSDIDGYEIEAWSDHFVINEQGDNWIEIEFIRTVTELGFDSLVALSRFSDRNYPDLSISITRIIPEDATDEEKAAIVAGRSSVPIDIDFGATRLDPVMLTADEEEYVEPNAIYLTGEVDGEIEIEGNYTYYRLDSSVNGNGYYQTLSTLYFSIPNEYLQNTGIPIVDMYVSAIELTYQSAMTNPVLYESVYNEEFREALADIKKGDKGWSAAPFVASKISMLDSPSSIGNDYSSLFRFSYAERTEHKNLLNTDSYWGEKWFQYPPLVIFANENSISPSAFQEFINTEDLNKYLKSNGLNNSCEEFEFTQFVLNFDEEYDLLSYKDMSFWEKADEFGLWNALKLWFNGTTEDFSDSIYNIKGIETLTSLEMNASLLMTDEVFANTYYVALSDVPYIKLQIENALSNNESFAFARFDVFDYYVEYAEGMYIDKIVEVPFGVRTDFNNEVMCFCTKYYKNLDAIRLETSNNVSTKVYKVVMDEISTPGGGATSPKPITPGRFGDGLKDEDSNLNYSLNILSIVLVVALVVFVVVYFWPIIGPAISAFFKWLGRMFVEFRGWLKRVAKRKRE